ncbi:hypothetical protein ABIA38_000456 [Embleya sp. AB8]
MATKGTVRFTAPAPAPIRPTARTPPRTTARGAEAPVVMPTFTTGDRVCRPRTGRRDSGPIVGLRTTEAGLVFTIRRWCDRTLYDATATDLTPDPLASSGRAGECHAVEPPKK